MCSKNQDDYYERLASLDTGGDLCPSDNWILLVADHCTVNSDMYLHHHRGQWNNDILSDDGIREQEKEMKTCSGSN